MRRRHVLLPFLLLAGLAPFACGGGSETGPTAGSGGATTGASSSGAGGASSSSSTSSSGGGGGDLTCPSALYCGDPAVCCAQGDECIGGACLAPCPGAVHCAGACCAGGQICLSGACATPGGPCTDSVDCKETEFCEPTLGKCLPQPPGGPTCQFHPVPGPFAPTLKWSWTGSPIKPTFDQLLSVPLVADVDKDGTPDVVIVTHDVGDGACDTGAAYVRLLDGKAGAEKWPAAAAAYGDPGRVAFCRTPALADLDGDGKPEILAHKFGGGLIAFKADGSILWTSTQKDGVTPYAAYFGWSSTISVADMDGDGKPEIVSGGVIFNAKGKLLAGAGTEGAGTNGSTSYGGNSLIADVDGDGKGEVLTGASAFNLDGSVKWTNAMADGYGALGDFDGDHKPELVVISGGTARVHDAVTGALLTSLDMPGTGAGGPPTIADFNGDKQLDFASAVGDSYTIFTFTKTPVPTISVLWSVPTADLSSSRTGSSIFDFEGDGAAEVLYNDECYLRVYDGKTGTVRFELASSSATAAQYPIAVDVDGDNHTELVVVSDDKYQLANVTPGCPAYKAGEKLRHGVFVYGDPANKWVRTRRIWNEHSYHVSNIDGSGAVPTPEVASFGASGLDTYRVSAQGNGTFNAPDLKVELAVLTNGCPATLDVRATVLNDGSLGVAAGVMVEVFYGKDASGMLAGKVTTKKALLPGDTEALDVMAPLAGKAPPYSFYARVDGVAPGVVDECNESDNDAVIAGLACPTVK